MKQTKAVECTMPLNLHADVNEHISQSDCDVIRSMQVGLLAGSCCGCFCSSSFWFQKAGRKKRLTTNDISHPSACAARGAKGLKRTTIAAIG